MFVSQSIDSLLSQVKNTRQTARRSGHPGLDSTSRRRRSDTKNISSPTNSTDWPMP